jgi:hypothetical protein
MAATLAQLAQALAGLEVAVVLAPVVPVPAVPDPQVQVQVV